MHELSIALGIIEAAQEEAESHGAAKVSAVHLRLGALSGVVKEALLFSYGVAAEGTSLEGSRLVIEDLPVIVFCPVCKGRRPVQSVQAFYCAECHTPAAGIVQGREIEVFALEVEE